MGRIIFKYNRETGKVERVDSVEKRRTTLDCGEGPNIMPDIKEYRAVGLPGTPMISSRSEHREQLRRHNMIEVGNEMPKWMKEDDDG